jgi:hypothetical protein
MHRSGKEAIHWISLSSLNKFLGKLQGQYALLLAFAQIAPDELGEVADKSE